MAWMNATSSRCHEHGHPEIRVAYESSLVNPEDVKALLDKVEQQVACGLRLSDGATFRLGWMSTRIKAINDDLLTLLEPDMIHTPPLWIEAVNHTLIHHRIHTGVCSSVLGPAEPVFPVLDEPAHICDLVGASEHLVMARDEGGWSFCCASTAHDHEPASGLRRISLFEAVVDYEPRALPYLALPQGSIVTFGGSRPRIELDGAQLEPASGSPLAAFLSGT